VAARRSDDPAAVPQSPGGADVAVGLAVDAKSLETGYAGLRRGGRLVLVVLVALQAGLGGQDGAHV
jgi:D-arabinose 1-dehydrogenase-like Zn-dependent alcohol dehydrogenase